MHDLLSSVELFESMYNCVVVFSRSHRWPPSLVEKPLAVIAAARLGGLLSRITLEEDEAIDGRKR